MTEKVASIAAEIGINTNNFQASIKSAKDMLDLFRSGMSATAIATLGLSAAFTAIAAYTAEAVQITKKYAESVKNLSDVSGASAEDTSRLIVLTRQYGVEISSLMMANKKLSSEGMTLTISTMAKLSDKYLSLNNAADRAKFLTDNFGRAGNALVDVMKLGSKAINEQSDAINKNLILTEKQVEQVKQMSILQKQQKDVWDGLAVSVGTRVIPVMSDLIATQNNLINSDDIYVAKSPLHLSVLGYLWQAHANNTDALIKESQANVMSAETLKQLSDQYTAELGLMTDLMGASTAMTAKIVYNNILAKLSVDGLTEAEFNQAQELGVALGVYDRKTADSAIRINALSNQFVDGSITAAQLRDQINGVSGALNTLNGIKTVYINLGASATGNGTPPPAKTQHSAGGSFVIPSSYGYEGFGMGNSDTASAGETVTITPAGQQPGGFGAEYMIGALNVIASAAKGMEIIVKKETEKKVVVEETYYNKSNVEARKYYLKLEELSKESYTNDTNLKIQNLKNDKTFSAILELQRQGFAEQLADWKRNQIEGEKEHKNYLDAEGKYATDFYKILASETSQIWKMYGIHFGFNPTTQPHSLGGSFVIPQTYGREGFKLGNGDTASAGERITITPANQGAGGASLSVGNIYIGNTSGFTRSDVKEMITDSFVEAMGR